MPLFLISEHGFHVGLVGTDVEPTDLVVGEDHVLDFQVDLEHLFLLVSGQASLPPCPKTLLVCRFSFFFLLPTKKGGVLSSQTTRHDETYDTTFGVFKFLCFGVTTFGVFKHVILEVFRLLGLPLRDSPCHSHEPCDS